MPIIQQIFHLKTLPAGNIAKNKRVSKCTVCICRDTCIYFCPTLAIEQIDAILITVFACQAYGKVIS